MGSAVSTNSSKLITKAVLNISSDVIQESKGKSNQDILIDVNNVEGNVTLNNISSNQVQNISSRNLFKALTNNENSQRINQEIEQFSKSLISGLNLGQISASISTLNDVIDNCINIKNNSLINCSLKTNQIFTIRERNIKGDVTITNLKINQLMSSVYSCVSDVSQSSKLAFETDEKIKLISSASAEGLDAKWIAIASALGVVGISFTGISVFKSILGPLLSAGGGYLCFTQYKKETKDKIISNFTYLKQNSLLKYDDQIVLKNTFDQKDKNLDFENYGDADVYECFNKKIMLYTGSIIKNLISDITVSDLSIEFLGNKLIFGMKNSDRYFDEKNYVIYNLKEISEIYLIDTLDKLNSYPNIDNTIVLDLINFNNTKKIHIFYIKDKKKIFFTTFELPPVIIGIKQKNKKKLLDIVEQNPIFLLGIGLIVAGILLTFFLNKK